MDAWSNRFECVASASLRSATASSEPARRTTDQHREEAKRRQHERSDGRRRTSDGAATASTVRGRRGTRVGRWALGAPGSSAPTGGPRETGASAFSSCPRRVSGVREGAEDPTAARALRVALAIGIDRAPAVAPLRSCSRRGTGRRGRGVGTDVAPTLRRRRAVDVIRATGWIGGPGARRCHHDDNPKWERPSDLSRAAHRAETMRFREDITCPRRGG